MSFAVSLDDGGWNTPAPTCAACSRSRATWLRPRFWSMLRDLVRFYRRRRGCRQPPGCIAARRATSTPRLRRRIPRRPPATRWRRPSGPSPAAMATIRPSLHPLLREPSPAAAERPAGLAHGDRRQPRVRAAADRALRRPHAPGHAVEVRREGGVVAAHAPAAGPALRPCRDRDPRRPGAAAAAHARRRAPRCSAPSATAATAPCCTRDPALMPRRRASGPAGTTWRRAAATSRPA
jgi:hypothetical protein